MSYGMHLLLPNFLFLPNFVSRLFLFVMDIAIIYKYTDIYDIINDNNGNNSHMEHHEYMRNKNNIYHSLMYYIFFFIYGLYHVQHIWWFMNGIEQWEL